MDTPSSQLEGKPRDQAWTQICFLHQGQEVRGQEDPLSSGFVEGIARSVPWSSELGDPFWSRGKKWVWMAGWGSVKVGSGCAGS